MEEKKKRWRPSLTAYRELEKKVADLESENAELKKQVRERQCSKKANEIAFLKEKIVSLEKNADYMDKELKRLRIANKTLADELTESQGEVTYLLNRTLWERIMNK